MADTLHTPAWAGLAPRDSTYHHCTGTFAQTLRRTIGLQGELLAAGAGPAAGAEGFYRFQPRDPVQSPLFLKVVAGRRVTDLVRADRLAGWLASRGQAVGAVIDTYPRPVGDGLFVLAYRLRRLRPVGTHAAQLRAVGRALGGLHRALRAYPETDGARAATAQRNRRFEHLRAASRRHADRGTALPDAAAQVLHGDLNAGNVMLDTENGCPFFMDFEDSLHNAHAPCVDLAMLVERLVLTRLDDDAQALIAAHALLDGYVERDGGDVAWHAPLANILRALAARALLLLEAAPEGRLPGPTRAAEVDKFEHLYAMAGERAGLLAAIQAHA